MSLSPWSVWTVAVLTGVSVIAFADAIAIATGAVRLDKTTLSHFPGASPVLFAVAIVLAVAFPAMSAAYSVRFLAPTAGTDVVIAGAGLLGWTAIVIELTGEFGPVQVFAIVTGALLAVDGAVHAWTAPPRDSRRDGGDR